MINKKRHCKQRRFLLVNNLIIIHYDDHRDRDRHGHHHDYRGLDFHDRDPGHGHYLHASDFDILNHGYRG